jgi:hypothetical protein
MFEKVQEEDEDENKIIECNDKKLQSDYLRRGEKSRKRYDP